MAKRLVGLLLCSMLFGALGAPVSAQESSSLEFDGDRTLTVSAGAGFSRGRSGVPSSPPNSCRYALRTGEQVRIWIAEQFVESTGSTPESFDALAAQGADFTFGENVSETFVARFCADEIDYGWWLAGDPAQVPGDFVVWWLEAFEEIELPDIGIVSAPNAAVPFLTNLPVGMRPSVDIVPESGNVTVPGAQTITVTAVPFEIRFESMDEAVLCAAPFASDEILISELEPPCSLTFEEPSTRGVAAPLTLTVRYNLETSCVPVACTFDTPADPLDLEAEIPITVVEALGLGQGR